ncbi:MAG: dTDP-4-dehydrorhamnose reductase [Acidobacteriia bacterium]|nr:dTDP-4-dehydrorhamnose reductase [Terriglobia bacterium]
MKVLIIGANGQLGSELVTAFERDVVVALAHKDLDITDHEASARLFERARPDVVINTSAYHQVDLCETTAGRAFEVNAFAVRHLAQLCRQHDALFLHTSTDYVFDGSKGRPYLEEDAPNPQSVYATAKLAGEYFVRHECPRHWVVRTCGLFGDAGRSSKGYNFVDLMLRLQKEQKPIRVVNDQVLAPTRAREAARKMYELIQYERRHRSGENLGLESHELYGIVHITAKGECSWFEFARTVFEEMGLTANLSPTTSEKFGAAAKRPSYSVLAHGKLAQLKMDDMEDWRDGLRIYLAEKRAAAPHPGPVLAS